MFQTAMQNGDDSEQCNIYRAQVTRTLSPAVIGLSSGFGAIWTGDDFQRGQDEEEHERGPRGLS